MNPHQSATGAALWYRFVPCLVAPLVALLRSSCGGGSDIAAKPRYGSANPKWGLVVMNAKTGELIDAVEPDRLSLTGSVRELFVVGVAPDPLGPDHRFTTSVNRNGPAATGGVLAGDLMLVAAGDLTFGGRAKSEGTLVCSEPIRA